MGDGIWVKDASFRWRRFAARVEAFFDVWAHVSRAIDAEVFLSAEGDRFEIDVISRGRLEATIVLHRLDALQLRDGLAQMLGEDD